MASKTSTLRLRKEFRNISRDPPPHITARPLPSNILKWYFVLEAPSGTPYEGGIFMGRLQFPEEYPYKPPGSFPPAISHLPNTFFTILPLNIHPGEVPPLSTSPLTHLLIPLPSHPTTTPPIQFHLAVYMCTPQGRFKCNQKLCLSMSDFHPETWNPLWSVSAVLTGLLSFMLGSEETVGSIQTSLAEKRALARTSHQFNRGDKIFRELFPEFIRHVTPAVSSGAARAIARDVNAHHSVRRGRKKEEEGESLVSLLVWLFVFLGLILFIFRLIAGPS